VTCSASSASPTPRGAEWRENTVDDNQARAGTPLKDTSQEVRELQTGVYRRLSPGERLELAFDLSVVARELAMSRLRRQHPAWSSVDLMKELLRVAFLPASVPESLR
jgi:hypothetical protein